MRNLFLLSSASKCIHILTKPVIASLAVICTFAELWHVKYNEAGREENAAMMRKIKLYYTESEAKIILRSLIRLKNELIRQGRYADIVDEVILLLVDAKIKRVRT